MTPSSYDKDRLEILERQHNTLIAKLEALAKEWIGDGWQYRDADPDYVQGQYKGAEECGKVLLKLITEAKQ